MRWSLSITNNNSHLTSVYRMIVSKWFQSHYLIWSSKQSLVIVLALSWISWVSLGKTFKVSGPRPPHLWVEKYQPYPTHGLLWGSHEDTTKLLTCFTNRERFASYIHRQTDTKQVIEESSKCLEIRPKHTVGVTENSHTSPQVFWRTMCLTVVFLMLICLPC